MATAQQEEKDEKDEVEEKPAPKPAPKVSEDDDGNVTVDLEPAPKPRAPRRERREESYNEMRRYRDEAETLRARVMALESQTNQRIQQVEQRMPAGADPYDRDLAEIRGQQELIQSALRSGTITSAEEVERLRRSFYDLDAKGRHLDRERIKREVRDDVRKEMAAKEGDYEERVLRSEYGDVIANPAAIRYATGLYHQLVAEGKPQTLATSREAMDKAITRFGIRPQAAPALSANHQARFAAIPAQAGTKNAGEVRLDSSQKKMALARWPSLDEHAAYTKMAALLQRANGADE